MSKATEKLVGTIGFIITFSLGHVSVKYADILILWSKKLEFLEKQETQFTQGCLVHTVLAGGCPKPIGNKHGRKTWLEPALHEDMPLLLLVQDSLPPSFLEYGFQDTKHFTQLSEKQGELQIQLCGPFLTSFIQGHGVMMHPLCKLLQHLFPTPCTF